MKVNGGDPFQLYTEGGSFGVTYFDIIGSFDGSFGVNTTNTIEKISKFNIQFITVILLKL